MSAVIFKDTNTVRAEIRKFGNITVDKYIQILQDIAMYGEVAELYYMQQATEDRYERLYAAEAKQFGVSVEEFKTQLGGIQ